MATLGVANIALINPFREIFKVLTYPSLLPQLASSFSRYLTIENANPNKTYNYATRGHFNFPIFKVTQHAPKCKIGESWLYIAVPVGSSIRALAENERLYVGAQTQDRMFRGDGMGGNNFHHAEMRAGNGQDNPELFLKSGNKIEILRISADSIIEKVASAPELTCLALLLQQPKHAKRHIGWWFEQYLLFTEPKRWRWNTDPADKIVGQVLAV